MSWINKGYQRVRHGLLSIVQMSVAAGLAYYVALAFFASQQTIFRTHGSNHYVGSELGE
ncbi:hypothetical protein FRC0360_02011 [Corynebacterium diphtheriae]|nr:hypothetical protein FRC0360_02011 [Corynebacterium diphtheriae]